MPKKLLPAASIPYPVEYRLQEWGTCIRNSRLRQRLKAAELCERVGITHTTLRRLEQGDPGAGVGLYLAVFQLLGVLDRAAPPLAPELMESTAHQRVVSRFAEVFDDSVFGSTLAPGAFDAAEE